MNFCEPWIECKLRDRLALYKKRYPAFDVDRVLCEVESWDEKSQRWAPYMSDDSLKRINRNYHKMQSLRSLACNEHL